MNYLAVTKEYGRETIHILPHLNEYFTYLLTYPSTELYVYDNGNFFKMQYNWVTEYVGVSSVEQL
jgi:hypothetical protein